MDPIAKHEAQRMAEKAVTTVMETVFEYDPARDVWHVRAGTAITSEVLHQMIRDSIGEREPITRDQMERSVAEALNKPRLDASFQDGRVVIHEETPICDICGGTGTDYLGRPCRIHGHPMSR